MVDAFATADDLASRLKRTFTDDEKAWITTLLGDASAYLREDVIGAQVWPQQTITFDAWPDGDGDVTLPQFPVVEVSSVECGGVGVPFVWRDDHVHTHERGKLTVTFTCGVADVPESLVRWCCVLVSQALLPIENQLGLTVGGLSSVAIDDFKMAFANAGEQTGMALSDRNIDLIRSQWRPAGSTVVGTR